MNMKNLLVISLLLSGSVVQASQKKSGDTLLYKAARLAPWILLATGSYAQAANASSTALAAPGSADVSSAVATISAPNISIPSIRVKCWDVKAWHGSMESKLKKPVCSIPTSNAAVGYTALVNHILGVENVQASVLETTCPSVPSISANGLITHAIDCYNQNLIGVTAQDFDTHVRT